MYMYIYIYELYCICVRLLNQEGSLMAFAGRSEKKEHVTAAIAANIWMSYEKNSRVAIDDKSLELIVLNCEVRM